MRIHLGANSRPISFEYYTDIGTEQEASETYYYHYDLHGNVIRVTDDAGATEITYTYDALGTIVSETNTNSIYNPFTWSGEAQIIHDPEFNTTASSPITGLYSSGSGYYNPETGTFLSGTGTPADVNPTSASAEEPTAQETKPAAQLGLHAGIAAVAGGVPVYAAPATSTDVAPEPTADTTPIIGIVADDIELSFTVIWGFDSSGEQMRLTDTEESYKERVKNNREAYKRKVASEKRAEEERKKKEDVEDGHYPGDGHPECGDPLPVYKDVNYGMYDMTNPWDYYRYYKACMARGQRALPEDVFNQIYKNIKNKMIYKNFTPTDLAIQLELAVWGTKDGNNYLMMYKLKGQNPVLFWGPSASRDADHRCAGMYPGAEYNKDAVVWDPSRDTNGAYVHARPT